MGNVPTINAIPTQYKGIEFRSRTEARWAVFLDELGFKWEYEPEGYQLLSGWYLPDFWLPEIDSFLEVKPTGDVDDPRWGELAALTNKDVYVTSGAPGSSHEMYGPDSGIPAVELALFRADAPQDPDSPYVKENLAMYQAYGRVGDYADAPYLLCKCARCGEPGCEWEGRSDRIKCKCESGSYQNPNVMLPAMQVAANYRFWNPGGAP